LRQMKQAKRQPRREERMAANHRRQTRKEGRRLPAWRLSPRGVQQLRQRRDRRPRPRQNSGCLAPPPPVHPPHAAHARSLTQRTCQPGVPPPKPPAADEQAGARPCRATATEIARSRREAFERPLLPSSPTAC
jgi:hypothetical protein